MKIIYNAVVLTDESRRKLMEKIPPKFNNTFYHHITINFGVQSLPDNIGETVSFDVVGLAEDDSGQAVVVSGVERNDNGIPHITLSTADGVKPVYSNKLVAVGFRNITPFSLEGVVKSFTSDGWVSQ